MIIITVLPIIVYIHHKRERERGRKKLTERVKRNSYTNHNNIMCMAFIILFFFTQEVVIGARLVKRMAFALLSGEIDQYVSFLPDIQGMVYLWEG